MWHGCIWYLKNKKITECEDKGYYFLFVVDSAGNEIITKLLNPI